MPHRVHIDGINGSTGSRWLLTCERKCAMASVAIKSVNGPLIGMSSTGGAPVGFLLYYYLASLREQCVIHRNITICKLLLPKFCTVLKHRAVLKKIMSKGICEIMDLVSFGLNMLCIVIQ